ncbi:hypothetical protein U5B43_05210 [Campylobacter sp. 9BO]|uniref:tyrosine-type recombinase/integrase n=1 Tax=Campylobacter sp. 9BO TaxID=3424759 RepID=UPI003D34D4B4
MDGKISKGLKPSYTDKIKGHFIHYILPKIGDMGAKDIKYSTLRDMLMPIFNPNNPAQSRLHTIHEIITHLHAIFSIAIKDDYIAKDPSFGLSDEFLTAKKFAQKNNISTNMPALTDEQTLKEFLSDLKNDVKMDFQTKNAIYLQIFTANRPANTAAAKWRDIDLEKGYTLNIYPLQQFAKHFQHA